jgi:hypothetical protein
MKSLVFIKRWNKAETSILDNGMSHYRHKEVAAAILLHLPKATTERDIQNQITAAISQSNKYHSIPQILHF